MTHDERARYTALVRSVRESTQSDFYAKKWASARADDLPFLERSELAETPLPKRSYVSHTGFAKVVAWVPPFISAWSFDALNHEPFGVQSRRPMVYFRDPHETIEKSLWCSLRGMTRLVGEQNQTVSLEIAEKFGIDSLVADQASALALLPYLKQRSEGLTCISLVDSTFDVKALAPLTSYATRVRLVRALPETGVIDEAEFSLRPIFSPTSDCVIERVGGELVVTKLRHLVTPVIRYRTGLRDR